MDISAIQQMQEQGFSQDIIDAIVQANKQEFAERAKLLAMRDLLAPKS